MVESRAKRIDAVVKEREVLDPTSSVPVYFQIANLLRGKIARGEFRPGHAIPAVSELSKTLGVASMTVRQAIAQLGEEGLLESKQGRGTFVLPPNLGSAKLNLDSLTDQLTDTTLSERSLSIRRLSANKRIAKKLDIRVGAPVIVNERVLARDGKALFYQVRYLLAEDSRHLIQVETGPESLRGLFMGYGEMGIKNGRVTLHASVLGRREAAVLKEKQGIAAWSIEYIYIDFRDRPVIWGTLVCRGSSLEFSAPVGISSHAASGTSKTRRS